MGEEKKSEEKEEAKTTLPIRMKNINRYVIRKTRWRDNADTHF